MKVLVIGSGGREHALCWKLKQSGLRPELFAAPGNPGMLPYATCLGSVDYLAMAESLRPDLTVVGPEAPLAAGVVDRFRAHGHAIVGPTAEAAQLETSKAFAKALMNRAGIPTARFVSAASFTEAARALDELGVPAVIKADGLAAGKGVIIAHTRAEADSAVQQLLGPRSRVIIEEFLTGEEVSFIVLSDGSRFVTLDVSQDHKTLNDNDSGPNTGGMGAYADGRILTRAQKEIVERSVIEPALSTMSAAGTPFTGFLYAGLMMTADGPKVLEFNARLGDPETQVLLHRMHSDFLPFLIASAHGDLSQSPIESRPDPSVCVVLAAHGYPGDVRTGDPISGLDQIATAEVFQAGVKAQNGQLLTNSGRVLGVTASGPDLVSAIAHAYTETAKIHFEGMHYRTDIGQKGLRRW